MDILIIILIIFIATFIQGMTSFGASMVMMPLLLFYFDLIELVPMLIIFALIMNGIILYTNKLKVSIKSILPLIISAFVFTFLGSYILKNVNENYLSLIIGIILIITSITNYFGLRFILKNPKKAYIPVGAISGLLNSVSSLNGPPVILFLSNQNVNKLEFKGTLTTYFFINNITTIITFIIMGNINLSIFITSLKFIPIVILGVVTGIYISTKVSDNLFKKIVLIFIFIMGSYLVIFNYFNIQNNLL